MSINRVNLSGNLTRDAELRSTQGGNAILTFGMAVNDRRKDPNTGEWTDYPNFVDLCLFGNRANALVGYLTKGAKVAVEGKLRYSSWEAQDGGKRSKLEVIVDEIEFLSPRNAQQQAPAYPQQAPTFSAPQQYAPQQAPQQQYAQQTVQPEQFAQVAQQLKHQQPVYSAPAQQYQQPELYDSEIPFD